ncbi:MAG: LTA synthase family protein [Bacteroidetes bacterium]|nr:LTA synthase family protein [Bacteroidota bacterium]
MPTDFLKKILYTPAIVASLLLFALLFGTFAAYRIFFYQYTISHIELPREAMLLGFQFDSVAAAYLMAIPVLLFIVSLWILRLRNIFAYVTIIYFIIVSLIVSLCIAADESYFKHFNTRITKSIHLWNQNMGQSLEFIFTDQALYPHIIFFVLWTLVLIILSIKIIKKTMLPANEIATIKPKIITSVILLLLLIITMRNGITGRPLSVRKAFTLNNAMHSQAALNPLHAYVDSYTFVKLTDMNSEVALNNVRGFVNLEDTEQPGHREIIFKDSAQHKNIVLILMESMCAPMMGYYNLQSKLTPFLDSLSHRSIVCKNFYSTGIHSCQGIYSSLYGLPGLGAMHPMADNNAISKSFIGLPQTLKSKNYATTFFCSHHESFDNLGMFLRKNGVDRVFHSNDYPASEKVNSWGISDQYMYEFALSKFDSIHQLSKSFLGSIITISTHEPQQVPPNTVFKARAKNDFDASFEYADWSLQQFFAIAKNKPWYSNSIFVITADHGFVIPYMPGDVLMQNHSPFILYDPSLNSIDSILPTYGNQADVWATLMDHLNISYTDYGLGQSLFSKKSNVTYFNRDAVLCAIDSEFLYLNNRGFEEDLIALPSQQKLKVEMNKEHKKKLKEYATSFVQSAQWLFDNKK